MLVVLVQLEVFRLIPVGPVSLFHQFASSEFHNVPNITVSYDIVCRGLGYIGKNRREGGFRGPTIAVLVDIQLLDLVTTNQWEALIRDAMRDLGVSKE